MKTETTSYRCDLCGWGGPLSDPADFVAITVGTTEVHLCWWCGEAGRMTTVESGDHFVTEEESGISWWCSCGQRFRHPNVPQHVLEAVPNLLRATATMHVTGRDGTTAGG